MLHRVLRWLLCSDFLEQPSISRFVLLFTPYSFHSVQFPLYLRVNSYLCFLPPLSTFSPAIHSPPFLRLSHPVSNLPYRAPFFTRSFVRCTYPFERFCFDPPLCPSRLCWLPFSRGTVVSRATQRKASQRLLPKLNEELRDLVIFVRSLSSARIDVLRILPGAPLLRSLFFI